MKILVTIQLRRNGEHDENGTMTTKCSLCQTRLRDERFESVMGECVIFFVYFEEIKREVQRILIYECRCNERPKVKVEGSALLTYTGLIGGLGHLKIET
jgi:hypothetical protein